MNALGQLFIIAAPSGAGKTSLVKALLASLDAVAVSTSHTTRPARPGEVDAAHLSSIRTTSISPPRNGLPQQIRKGDYYFVDKPMFQQLIAEDAFLEYAQVFDYFYGTSRAEVDQRLQHGIDVILEIDWQGAQQVREKQPNCQSIYILPPSLAALKHRLEQRGQDNSVVIERRMRDAVSEMSHYSEFDYIIINDDFEQSLQALKAIFLAQRHTLARQKTQHGTLLSELLAPHSAQC